MFTYQYRANVQHLFVLLLKRYQYSQLHIYYTLESICSTNVIDQVLAPDFTRQALIINYYDCLMNHQLSCLVYKSKTEYAKGLYICVFIQ